MNYLPTKNFRELIPFYTAPQHRVVAGAAARLPAGLQGHYLAMLIRL